MSPHELRERLGLFPRLNFAVYPTPLEPLPNLTGRLGGPQIWIKRDDGIGPGLGGNKGRKLEYLMAEAVHKGYHKVITFGGLQSNHARMTAAACARLALDAHLFFFERRPANFRGNLVLDQLFGARLHFIPFGGGSGAAMRLETTNRLVRALAFLIVGPGAYFIPVGGHNVTGCLGYVEAACELHEQVQALGLPAEKTTVVTAAGSGGTLAGLVAGLALLNSPLHVLGLDIGKLWKGFPASLAKLASALCSAVGKTKLFEPAAIPLVEATYAGPGYAKFMPSAGQAIRALAETEGILLDPVYTGKAFAGMLQMIGEGAFRDDGHLIFLHTGGMPGLWAYELEMENVTLATATAAIGARD